MTTPTDADIQASLDVVRRQMTEVLKGNDLKVGLVSARIEVLRWVLTLQTDGLDPEEAAIAIGETVASMITDVGMTATQSSDQTDAVREWQAAIVGVILSCLQTPPNGVFATEFVKAN